MPSVGVDVRLRMIVPHESPPWVPSAALLLNLQADALSLNDNDPVSLWSDISGLGHDFSQTGTARPTFLANYNGYPAVYFPSGPPNYDSIWMDGGVGGYVDNLPSFSIFHIALCTDNNGDIVIAKQLGFANSSKGWQASFFGAPPTSAMIGIAESYPSDYLQVSNDVIAMSVVCSEILSNSNGHVFVNGDNTNESTVSAGTVSTFSNNTHILLGGNVDSLLGSTMEGWIRAVMIYAPAPNANDRMSITTWLAAKYGIILP